MPNDDNQGYIQDELPITGTRAWNEAPLSVHDEEDTTESKQPEPKNEQRVSGGGNPVMLRRLIDYRNNGPLDPALQPIMDEIIETYKKCGYLYRERRHILDPMEHITKSILIGVLCLVVLYCFIVVGAQNQNPVEQSPYLYFTMVGISVLGFIFSLVKLVQKVDSVGTARKMEADTDEKKDARRKKISSTVKDSIRWLFITIYVGAMAFFCVATQFIEWPLIQTTPLMYFGATALLILQALFGVYMIVRQTYKYLNEYLIVNLALVVVDNPYNRWLYLMAGEKQWPTRHYSNASGHDKTLIEAWFAKRSQTATIEMPGAGDTKPLHDRRHTIDVDRLRVAIEMSSFLSRGNVDSVAIHK